MFVIGCLEVFWCTYLFYATSSVIKLEIAQKNGCGIGANLLCVNKLINVFDSRKYIESSSLFYS